MEKYIIEGGIDFFSELYKSLDIEENNCKTEEDENLCLITKQPLTEYFVKMNCGHKFNYIPLYKDILAHKHKFNSMEGHKSLLKINEIRCPYCRSKQLGVLPYYEALGLNKINGVNIIDNSYDYSVYNGSAYNGSSSNYKKCVFLNENLSFNPNSENIVEEDFYNYNMNQNNVKYFKCANYGSKFSPEILLELNDDKCYCYTHKKVIIKKHKKDLQNKIKEENKLNKLKEKEQAKKLKEESKKLKEEAKQKEKETKQKEKEVKKKEKQILNNSNKKTLIKKKLVENKHDCNIILGPAIITINENENENNNDNINEKNNSIQNNNNDIQGCYEIIKTGIKKGKQCENTIFKDNCCKRHYNLKHKEVSETN